MHTGSKVNKLVNKLPVFMEPQVSSPWS